MLTLLALVGCSLVPSTLEVQEPALAGQDVMLTLLHTTDIHSRILPYDFDPSFTDNSLGLADCDPKIADCTAGHFGGIARTAYILKREREKAGRVLHFDSGDYFQGAVIFNEFEGEAEVLTLSEAGLDAACMGNHEFDKGAANLASQLAYASYPVLAANYRFEDSELPWASQLQDIVQPRAMFEMDGLRVGVIGLGNLSSLYSVYNEDNSMGITPMEPGEVIPEEASILKAQGADIIVVLSHLGLDDDVELAQEFDEIDVILGGHHHVALVPPLAVTNRTTGKIIPVVHSGGFSKFVGRLDLVVRDDKIVSHTYTLFPIDSSVPDDPATIEVLNRFTDSLDASYNLNQRVGYAESELLRYGSTGGDSMLGNFTADAMRFYEGVETEIALNNTLGIRADIPPGDITIDAIFNSMPFDNTVTTMYLTGREVQEMLDYVSSRSTDRGCNSQGQVSGIRFTMCCDYGYARDIVINGVPLDPDGTYELATNNYVAAGGSGFEVLERNTTQQNLDISIRDVVLASIQSYQTLPQPGVAEEDGRILASTECGPRE